MCSMNTLSYPSTESSHQSLQHLFVHVSLIQTWLILIIFTTSHIGLKPSNYLSHVNRGTTSMSSRTITSFNLLTLLSFSCFYNTLIWIPISLCYIIILPLSFIPNYILVCIRLPVLSKQCLINCFCSNCFYSLSENATSLSPCDCL